MIILAVLLAATVAEATTIKYQLIPLGGSDYRYEWLVINNPLSVDVTDFLIYFSDVLTPNGGLDPPEATNLAVYGDVPNWTESVQPPSAGPTNFSGYYEAFADSGFGIAPGNSLGGFSATCTWAVGAGGPGSQYFEVYDDAYNLIDFGHTVPMGGEPVIPEWGSAALALMGLGPVMLVIRRKR
jgi:hypothetical protein